MAKIKTKSIVANKIRNPNEYVDELNYPVFSFKHLQNNPKNPKDKPDFYAEYIERLKKISSITWNEINCSQRHSFGKENIPVSIIKPRIPAFVTPDAKHLTAFRATGDNRPFLGIRRGNVFFVIFIEESFGDVYNHD